MHPKIHITISGRNNTSSTQAIFELKTTASSVVTNFRIAGARGKYSSERPFRELRVGGTMIVFGLMNATMPYGPTSVRAVTVPTQ